MQTSGDVPERAEKAILYIGGFELPDRNAAAQRVIANGKIFKELGYSVYFIGVDRSLSKSKPIESTKSILEEFVCYSVRYPVSVTDWIDYLTSVKEVIRIAEQINSLEDIVAYNYPGVALARLSSWCRSKGINLIADCTEWYEPQGGLLFRMIKGFDTYLRMKIIQPKLDGMIAISSYLHSFYINQMNNVIQVPPLVDSRAEKWLNNCEKSNEKLSLVYAGSPGSGSKDRLDTVLEALSIVKTSMGISFSMNIVGLTKEQYTENFGDSAFPSVLENDVTFKGRVPHTDALNEVKCADYAIFIRDNNLVNTAGFPTKFVEALSCGTPVLANESSNIADYLKNNENGYLLDNSTKENLVHTFNFALSQDKEKIYAMKALIKSSNIFDFRNYIEPVKQFLNSVRVEKGKSKKPLL